MLSDCAETEVDVTRVAIVGAGAMGSVFGVALAQTEADVVLVDVNAAHVAAINRAGLAVEAADGTTRQATGLRAVTDPADEAAVDLLFVFVKGVHTDAAMVAAAPLIGPSTVVVSLQNGWGNGDVVARHVDPRRIVVGTTLVSAGSLGPGRVAETASGVTKLGPFVGDDLAGAERTAQVLRAAGLEVEVSTDVRRDIWTKLVLNAAANPTGALTGLHASALVEHAPMWQLVQALAREAVVVARAEGYDLDADAMIASIREVLVNAGPSRASMLQDFDAGRASEIDVITGAVVRAAARHGIDVPHNATILALVQGVERAR
jgi:2-dehydropantoate 2-reductase